MPIAFNWQRTYAWDRKHCNVGETKANDPNPDRIAEATESTADDETKFLVWRDLALDGSVFAMVETAYRFEAGVGVGQDLASAEHWYEAAAAGGSQWGALRAAKLKGDRKDFTGCNAILSDRAADGWVPAKFWSAWYRLKEVSTREAYAEVRPWLEDAAEAGHPGAQWLLGRAMASGKYGGAERAAGRAMIMTLSSKIVVELDDEAKRSAT